MLCVALQIDHEIKTHINMIALPLNYTDWLNNTLDCKLLLYYHYYYYFDKE